MAAAAIETRGLSKRYGRVQAVADLSLRVEPGQIYGFLGPNGAGKSTTMRVLLGLVRPSAGEARVWGQACGTVAARGPGLIGALVEDPAFYGYLTARQNLALLGRLSGGVSAAQLDQTLELVGLREDQHRRVAGYSHGMRQRLGLAQALLPRPRLLVLDEPTNGLDPRARVEMRRLLQRLSAEQQVTIFLSSHLLGEVEQLCTHLALLSRGRALAAGPTGELLAASTVRVELEADPPESAERLLASRPAVSGLTRQGDRLLFTCERRAVAPLNRALVEAGCAVSSLTPRAESLEDFYLRLTEEADHAAGTR